MPRVNCFYDVRKLIIAPCVNFCNHYFAPAVNKVNAAGGFETNGGVKMPEKWTGDLIGRMHNARVTLEELGNEMGVSKPYVSMILNGLRRPKGAQERFETAFENIVQRRAEQGA